MGRLVPKPIKNQQWREEEGRMYDWSNNDVFGWFLGSVSLYDYNGSQRNRGKGISKLHTVFVKNTKQMDEGTYDTKRCGVLLGT